MKAADIPDDVAIDAVRSTQGMHGVPNWSTLWDVQNSLPTYPPKVVTAKLASLIKRGKLKGTAQNGCRGDFELVEKS
jgi:hypothetical protein